jgi:hypothetical protein
VLHQCTAGNFPTAKPHPRPHCSFNAVKRDRGSIERKELDRLLNAAVPMTRRHEILGDHLSMPRRTKRVSPSLKHGAYSQAWLLPGEDPDEFEELHRGLIAEFGPNGRFEEETVASIARLMWRRQNVAMFEIGQLATYVAHFEKAAAQQIGEPPDSKEDAQMISDVEKIIEENRRTHKAKESDQEKAGAKLLSVFKTLALNRLMKELEVEERLDGMIDRLIKRLLFVRASNQSRHRRRRHPYLPLGRRSSERKPVHAQVGRHGLRRASQPMRSSESFR